LLVAQFVPYIGILQEKVTGSFKEGRVHEDVWALLLKPTLAGAAAAGGMHCALMHCYAQGITIRRTRTVLADASKLTPLCVTVGAKGGLSALDLGKANWQKISRKGDFPSTRCGSAVTMYKNKALLFGGVFDEEGACLRGSAILCGDEGRCRAKIRLRGALTALVFSSRTFYRGGNSVCVAVL
jgi:hypothetical protein